VGNQLGVEGLAAPLRIAVVEHGEDPAQAFVHGGERGRHADLLELHHAAGLPEHQPSVFLESSRSARITRVAAEPPGALRECVPA